MISLLLLIAVLLGALPSLVAPLLAASAKINDNTRIQQPTQIKPTRQLSPAAQARDPKWNGNSGTVSQGCTGLDLIVSKVSLTRYTDRGKIGVHADVANKCSGRTDQLIRVVFNGFPGTPHIWVRGIGPRGTGGVGTVIDDNASHNRAIGPLSVTVNPSGEIAERNSGNNTCSGAQMTATQNRGETRCH